MPPGWGSAADVQERYIDSYRRDIESDVGESQPQQTKMTEEEFEKREEERIFSAWREWKREEEQRKKSGTAATQAQAQDQVSATGMGRDGMSIKEKWQK